ncbi:hypothetical protein NMG60_11015489 [Bertholletia excelsa]
MESAFESFRPSSKRKGGFGACMFVYALAGLDSIGSVANMSVMVLYFNLVMRFNISESANTFTNYMGSTFLLSILGGFISDTYLGRLSTCLSFGLLQIAALVMITVQAYSPKLQPDPTCEKATCVKGGEALMFYASLSLLALGQGGVRGALPALGADQFDIKDEKGAKGLATYFNWFVLSTTIGSMLGVTGVVWISMYRGWYKGFLLGTITSSLPLGNSPIVRVARVLVLAFRNRNLSLPENPELLYEVDDKDRNSGEEKILRQSSDSGEGNKAEAWKVCTVTQVEEVKILTRMLPILASTVIMNTCLSQLQTFSVVQGYMMDPHLGRFKIPSASIPVIPLFFMFVLIPAYEFLVWFSRPFPWALQVWLLPVTLSSRLIEVKRRNQALRDPKRPISLFWLSFQYGIFGFFYKEAPSGMRSLSTSFAPLSLAIGAFLSTVFVNLINSITQRITPSKQGWLHGPDLNHSNLNLFYWFLAVLSCLNFANYLYWASWYKENGLSGLISINSHLKGKAKRLYYLI